MAVEKIAPTYKARDGREFDDEQAAEAHDKLVEARHAYQDAARDYSRILAETQKTADGAVFSFSVWTDYFYITKYTYEVPRLLRISYFSRSDEVTDRDGVCISHSDGNGQKREFPISDLYVDEAKGKAALVAAQIKWLQEQFHYVRTFAAKNGIETPALIEPKPFTP